MAWDDLSGEPKLMLSEWAARYIERFERAHTWPAPLRAARVIRRRFQEPLDVTGIAREVGTARSVLIRGFRRTVGMSMRDYQARCRIRAGIALLRQPPAKVGAAAYAVGYRSNKNFYRALRALTGLTPSDIRKLDDVEVVTLLASPAVALPSFGCLSGANSG